MLMSDRFTILTIGLWIVVSYQTMAQTATSVGGSNISVEEMTSPVRERLFRLQTEEFELKRKSLLEKVRILLLEAESRERGISIQALLAQEVGSKVTQPSANELSVASEAIPGTPSIETLRDLVVGKRRRTAERAFERRLWIKFTPKLNLDVPRWPERLDRPHAPRLGSPDARLRIVVFSDFECPYCARLARSLPKILQQYPEASLTFLHFPLNSHGSAYLAAQVSVCAERFGKFWHFHDLIYQNNTRLTIEDLRDAWASAGLPADKFTTCLEDTSAKNRVNEDSALARKSGLKGTPTLFVNERLLLSGGDPEELDEVLFEELRGVFLSTDRLKVERPPVE